MPVDLIDRILEAARVGETTDWEFKSAKGGFPGSFWETYSAFANSEGGVIILGVREKDGSVHLDGLTLEQAAQNQKYLWDNVHNRNTVSANLLTTQDVNVVDLDGPLLLAIHVPRATRTQRPVYLGHNPIGHTFQRHHEGDYRCTDAEVRRMLADADETPPDHRVLQGFGLDDLDKPSLVQYRQRLRSAKGEHPWYDLDDKALLEKLGGWMRNRTTGEEGLTLAGLLMFGKDTVIRHPEAAPNYFVDYREKLDPAIRWTDRIYPDGTWEANLFQFYVRVWPKIAAGLPTPFRLEHGERRDVTPAHEALREAFVNSLIHGDYNGVGGVVAERYPDRFVLENPGTLLVSLEQYLRGGVSECRNKALQQMFLMIGGGERAGSGADKIRSGWRTQHWRAPRISIQKQPDRVMLELPMISLIPEDALSALKGKYGAGFIENNITPAELQALATAYLEGEVSNTRLQELLIDHPSEITHMLQGLCHLGVLQSDNRRRWSRYQLSGGGVTAPSLFDTIDSSHLTCDSLHKDEDSSHKSQDSSHKSQDSSHSNDWELLETIARKVSTRERSSIKDVRDTILSLCQERYLTAEQISRLLKRNVNGLRNRYLSPMVGEKLLTLRHPEAANRPDQAYTATEDSQ
ncbi:MAG: RNA-binding domain-containing protein [Geobacteraceae bacterium]